MGISRVRTCTLVAALLVALTGCSSSTTGGGSSGTVAERDIASMLEDDLSKAGIDCVDEVDFVDRQEIEAAQATIADEDDGSEEVPAGLVGMSYCLSYDIPGVDLSTWEPEGEDVEGRRAAIELTVWIWDSEDRAQAHANSATSGDSEVCGRVVIGEWHDRWVTAGTSGGSYDEDEDNMWGLGFDSPKEWKATDLVTVRLAELLDLGLTGTAC